MQCRSWNHINELLILCYIKIHWSISDLWGCFNHAGLFNIIHSPFGKYWFIKICRSSNVDTFHETIKNITFINITFILSEKSLSFGKLSSSWLPIYVFQNTSFCSKAQIFSLATKSVNVFFEMIDLLRVPNHPALPKIEELLEEY